MKSVAVIGSGPAALMAADVISGAGHQVTVFEKKKGPGRKLLIAGSSGLNITNSLPHSEFLKNYTGPPEIWKSLLADFSPQNWIGFIESLGLSTFEGTSGRYFVKEMKASKLLRAWIERLNGRGVEFLYSHELSGFNRDTGADNPPSKWQLNFSTGSPGTFDAICFCLGGGSYEPNEVPLRWPNAFISKNIGFDPFIPSNVGYQVEWSDKFLTECEGQPLKNVRLISSRGSRLGDVIVTRYGLEGTPVYFVGQPGVVRIDLKPDLSVEQILSKCRSVKENLSPMRRIKKQLSLCPASLGLLFHFTPKNVADDLNRLVSHLKNFPLQFLGSQSLDEAISSAGGLHMTELTADLMLIKYPGVFAAGEMLNWDAPTGGFLIQACVSQGYRAGQGILRYLGSYEKTGAC
ncbi:MAG: TIGR03862 family flavoprotein [Bdellovibrionia bacterium]